MMPFRHLSLLAVVLVLTGCPDPNMSGTGGGGGSGGSAGQGGGAGGSGGTGGNEGYAQSAKANVRFKRNVRLTFDYSNALGLQAQDLCKELGQYPCTTVVHPLALGGVDPYGIGLYEPLPFTGLASPIVTDRVALSACISRVALDLGDPANGIVFRAVVPDGAGKLNPASTEVHDAIDTLYKRVLLRHPTPEEYGHLKQLYVDIEASGKPEPGKAWMQLSCFAVLTTVEALFY